MCVCFPRSAKGRRGEGVLEVDLRMFSSTQNRTISVAGSACLFPFEASAGLSRKASKSIDNRLLLFTPFGPTASLKDQGVHK